MDFPLVIIELFSLAVMLVELRANIDYKAPFQNGVGHFGPKISHRRRHPPPTILRVGELDELTFHTV